jgi:hypothetical protein
MHEWAGQHGPTWAQSGPNARDVASQDRLDEMGMGTESARLTRAYPTPPIWGSRGREFKSRQPDRAKYLVRQQIHPSKYLYFMIVFAVDHLF